MIHNLDDGVTHKTYPWYLLAKLTCFFPLTIKLASSKEGVIENSNGNNTLDNILMVHTCWIKANGNLSQNVSAKGIQMTTSAY